MLLALLLVVPACGTPCPTSAPLLLPRPGTDPQRWVVRFNEAPAAPEPMMLPGMETFVDPPGTETYAVFAVYSGTEILNPRWLDNYTRWVGASATVNAAAMMPSRLGADELTLLLPGGARPIVTFDITDGEVTHEIATSVSPPEAGGQIVDVARLAWDDEELALATRRRGSGGVGGDLLLIDTAAPVPGEVPLGVLQTVSLAALSTGAVEPTWIVAIAGDDLVSRVIVGLHLIEEENAGAVAVINLERPVIRPTSTSARITSIERLDLVGLAWCTGIVPLPPERVAADTPRAAVLCTGDVTQPAMERNGAGIAVLDSAPGEPVRVASVRLASTLFSGRPPTGELIALAGDWVAYVSRGDAASALTDALMAIDLGATSDAREILYEEPWTEGLGAPLGRGDFAPASGIARDATRDCAPSVVATYGELWWPAARVGILRWTMRCSAEGSVSFLFRDNDDLADPSDDSPELPGCHRLPARSVRALPRTAAPPMPDAGMPDAGMVDAGDLDAGGLDAGVPDAG